MPTVVQTDFTATSLWGTSPRTVAMPFVATTGNSLFIYVEGSGFRGVRSLTDDHGHTWVQEYARETPDPNSVVFRCGVVGANPPETLTVTWDEEGFENSAIAYRMWEVSGLDGNERNDIFIRTVSPFGLDHAVSTTTTAADDFVFCYIGFSVPREAPHTVIGAGLTTYPASGSDVYWGAAAGQLSASPTTTDVGLTLSSSLSSPNIVALVYSAGVVLSPTIETQPTNQTVTAPTTATFTVAATASAGGGTLSYQWQVNTGSGYTNVDTGTGGTTASYTTPATTTAMTDYLYRCNVTDDNGVTSSTGASLTVNAAANAPDNPTRLLTEDMPSGNNSTGPIVSSSISPAGNALILFTIQGVVPAGVQNLTITSTFSTVGAWSWERTVIPAIQGDTVIAWAVTTETPGSGTISATIDGTNFSNITLFVDQIASGFNTTTPIGAVISGANGVIAADDLTPTGTFSATPASSSLLFGAIQVVTSVGSVPNAFSLEPESGLTSLGDFDKWQHKLSNGYGPGTHGNTMGWVADTGTEGASIVGLEVLAAGGVPVMGIESLTFTTRAASAALPMTVNYPATVNEGDLLVMVAGYGYNATGQTSLVVATPSDWTRRTGEDTLLGGASLERIGGAVFTRIATAGLGGTTFSLTFGDDTLTGARTIVGIMRTTGLDYNVDASLRQTADPLDFPSVTTTVDGATIIRVLQERFIYAADPTPPTGHTVYDDAGFEVSHGSGQYWLQQTDAQTTQGATGVVTWAKGNYTEEYTATIALTPAETGPTINTQPGNQTVTAPATATFTVAATASGGSLTYQWQVNDGGGYVNVSTGSGGTTASYTTPATTIGMTGYLYRCNVTDDNGTTATTAATLTVNATAVNAGFRITGIQAPNGTAIGSVSPVSVAIWNNAAAAHGSVATTVITNAAIVNSILEVESELSLAAEALIEVQYVFETHIRTFKQVVTIIDLDV